MNSKPLSYLMERIIEMKAEKLAKQLGRPLTDSEMRNIRSEYENAKAETIASGDGWVVANV